MEDLNYHEEPQTLRVPRTIPVEKLIFLYQNASTNTATVMGHLYFIFWSFMEFGGSHKRRHQFPPSPLQMMTL